MQTISELHRHRLLLRLRRPRLVPPFLAAFFLISALFYLLDRHSAGSSWIAPLKPAAVTRSVAIAAGAAIDPLYRQVNRGRIEHAKSLVRKIAEETGGREDSTAAVRAGMIDPPPSRAAEVIVRQEQEPEKTISVPIRVETAVASNGPAPDPEADRRRRRETSAPALSASQEALRSRTRTFRLLLIGIDSRLGRIDARADALHVVAVDLDQASVRITAIPRGTRVRLGYQNEASNIISNVRSARGRSALMQAASEIAGCGPIAYYVEVGFSQAMGVLELLGYANPAGELALLRRREGLQYGDRERSYEQALFLRKTLLRSFNLLTGVTGELILSAGLLLVETNLTKEICQGLIYSLQEKGFPRSEKDVAVELHSPFERQVERRVGEGEEAGGEADRGASPLAARKLRALLARCGQGDPEGKTLRVMERVFDQRGWLQIPDMRERELLRDSLAALLMRACVRTGNPEKIRMMQERLRGEDSLFHLFRSLRPAKLSTLH